MQTARQGDGRYACAEKGARPGAKPDDARKSRARRGLDRSPRRVGVAHFGERLVCNQEVAGSIPVVSTRNPISFPPGKPRLDSSPGINAALCGRGAMRFIPRMTTRRWIVAAAVTEIGLIIGGGVWLKQRRE